jgi:transcriptional regulator
LYVPPVFKLEDPVAIAELMRRNPFATMVSTIDGEPFATHLPILVEDGGRRLAGHVSRGNRHWNSFDGETTALMIFHGAHAYVSPRLYESSPNVPTWNYASVHAYGRPVKVADPEEVLKHVLEVVHTFDSRLHETTPSSFDDVYLRKTLPGLVAFRMEVERVEAKVKLNQNKSAVDREAVTRAFLDSEDAIEREVGRLMAELAAR